MIRNKTTLEIPDFILTSDWHLREDQPVCRTDDFEVAQWNAVDFVSGLQKKYGCPVLHAGDLFDFWKPSPDLLTKTMQHLPKQFLTIYGQHDVPQHSLKLAYKSGIYCLQQAGSLTVLPCMGGWGLTPDDWTKYELNKIKNRTYFVWHTLVYQGKKLWPGAPPPMAAKLLRKYTQFDLILTGDNHQSFVEEYEGRILVNPGSLTRQTASQIDFKPSVYLYYAKTNTVKRVFIPIETGVISREHIEHEELRDARIDAFISGLNTDWKIGFDFKENLKNFAAENEVKNSTMELVYKSIES